MPSLDVGNDQYVQVAIDENIQEKAAPWWEQQEEAAKRKCQSSCTMHSRGVKNPAISLCDDTDVSLYLKLNNKMAVFKRLLAFNWLCKSSFH